MGATIVVVTTIAVVLSAQGLAVAGDGRARVLPWDVAAGLLDDPGLTLVAADDLPVRDLERLLAAIAANDPEAPAVAAAPSREGVAGLRARPRRWARTVSLAALAGGLDAACCRAGLALPDPGDALAMARAAALLADRHQVQVAMRERLLRDHPHLGDAAWTATTGALAERVVMPGVRPRAAPPVDAAELPVADLLGAPGRFACRRDDTAAAVHAILAGTAAWDAHGRLELDPVGGMTHDVGGTRLRLGVGGLHSEDAPGVVEGPLVDLDVASYYPSIIRAEGIHPPQLPDFAARVGALMDRRLAAKRAGDRLASDALKLVVNSLYGQLGNNRSGLWSPPDALRVVLTGQLRLLTLIDGILADGGELVSANTDGVVVRCARGEASARWQAATGFTLEAHAYRRLFRTSVNDYIAVGEDGGVAKTKGLFGGGDDRQAGPRSAAPIIARAALARLVHGRDPAETIAAAGDTLDFTMWRRARDLRWGDQPIERPVVRWLASRQGRPLVQDLNGVARTVAAAALLVDDPAAVHASAADRAWYVQEARQLVAAVLGDPAQGEQQSIW